MVHRLLISGLDADRRETRRQATWGRTEWTFTRCRRRWRAWLFACALLCPLAVSAQVLDVRIHDTFGASYKTSEIGDQLGALYNIAFDPVLVVILGPSLSDERIQAQREMVRTFDPDTTGVLYAIGTPAESYHRGYSVTPNEAAGLLPAPDAFRVLVVNANGRILLDEASPIPSERLMALTPGQ